MFTVMNVDAFGRNLIVLGIASRLLLKVGESQKKVCVPKIGLKFPAPLIHFIF